jgi:hypothetical protein
LSDDTGDRPNSEDNPERTMFDMDLLARIQAQEAIEAQKGLDGTTDPESSLDDLEGEPSTIDEPTAAGVPSPTPFEGEVSLASSVGPDLAHAFDERPTEDGFGETSDATGLTKAEGGVFDERPTEDGFGETSDATGLTKAEGGAFDERPTEDGFGETSDATGLTEAEGGALDEPTSAGTFPSRPRPTERVTTDDLWADGSDNIDLAGGPPRGAEVSHAEATAAIDLQALDDTGNLEPEVAAQVRAELGEENTDPESAEGNSIELVPHHPQHPQIEVGHRALVIGRSETADLAIADDTLSRRHCSLWYRKHELWVEDLNSGNGTFVNGQRISEPTLLRAGDEVLIGQTIRYSVPNFAPPDVTDAPLEQGTLMGSQGGYSTTFAHTGSLLKPSRLKRILPLAAAVLVFVMGISVFGVRHKRAYAQQAQLDRATQAFFQGIEAYKTSDLDGAVQALEQAKGIDEKHPRLALYLARVHALRATHQALDRVEKSLTNGALDDATTTLYALTPTAYSKARIEGLERKVQAARLSKEVERFNGFVVQKNFNLAVALLEDLRRGALRELPEEIARLAKKLPKGSAFKGAEGVTAAKLKTTPRNRRSSIEGPLKRVHLALRQGQIEAAFTINRDLAASGVRAASRLEGSGNLAELRERHRMAESAVGERNWRQGLAATDRALKLIRKISPSARGTLRKLKHLRAEAWLAKATDLGNNSKLCEARKALDNAAKNNSKNNKVKNGFTRLRNFAKTKLDFAVRRLAEGSSKAAMTPHLKLAQCLAKRGGPIWKEARKLLR